MASVSFYGLLTSHHSPHPSWNFSFFYFFTVPQNAPPIIVFKKRQFYVGENLVANCSTSRSKPVPHIVWLINGKKVNIWSQISWLVFIFLFFLCRRRRSCRALKSLEARSVMIRRIYSLLRGVKRGGFNNISFQYFYFCPSSFWLSFVFFLSFALML